MSQLGDNCMAPRHRGLVCARDQHMGLRGTARHRRLTEPSASVPPASQHLCPSPTAVGPFWCSFWGQRDQCQAFPPGQHPAAGSGL